MPQRPSVPAATKQHENGERVRGRRSFWYRNGLSLALLALLLATLAGQILSGHRVNNDDLVEHGAAPITLLAYLSSGAFFSATFENWESEFLQMGMYVVMTARLRQWGSAESLPLAKEKEPAPRETPYALRPWPVRRGGWWLKLYENSLALAFLVLFGLAFTAHLIGSWREHIEELRLHGQAEVALSDYVMTAQFWFQSFQNWQSEFLAVLALVVLTIFLRQKGSPQSKAVDAPCGSTGD